MQVQVWDIDASDKDLDILGQAEFNLGAVVKEGSLSLDLKDPSKGGQKGGDLVISYEQEAFCSDLIDLDASASLKAIGGGCCGGGDHPVLTISRQMKNSQWFEVFQSPP